MEPGTSPESSLLERIDARVRREQAARARGFGWVLMSITASATIVSTIVGGEFGPLRIAWLLSLAWLFGVSAHVVRVFHPPKLARRGLVGIFGFSAVLAGLLSTAYLGVFSPVPLVVTTGIAFFGQARTPWISWGVSVSVIVGTLVMALLFTLRPSWDPGVIAATDVATGWRLFFAVMVPFVMMTTWWQARVEIKARISRIGQLSQALEQAEAGARTKGRFLANMSHEIRTPLNGISGMAALLAGEAREPQNVERIEVIRDSANALMRILNDVLDSAQLEAGELRIQPEPFEVLSVVDGVIGTLGPAAHAKGIELVSQIHPRAEGVRMGDEGRIRQILLNLVHNALKFTDTGFVSVDVQPSRDDQLAIVVRDTGRGIEPQLRDAVFKPFTQADDSRRRRFGGSGLGLAIARRLAERMGGSLAVETTVGLGSSFALLVPLPPHSDAAPPSWPELKGLGVRVELPDGQLASAVHNWFADRGADSEDPDGPFIELKLFRTPGGESRLRIEGPEVRVPTSVGLPMRWGRLGAALKTALGRGVHVAGVAGPTGERTLYGTVLVVDDNEVNIMVARGMLEAAGARVLTASNAALARVALNDPEVRLILMDVQMPEVDGIELTKQLRAEGWTLPIVGFTAHADAEARSKCRAAGMDGHLAKPVQQQLLLSTVAGLLNHDEPTRPRGASQGDPSGSGPVATT